MKQSRLVFTAVAAAAFCTWAFVALASPDQAGTKASSASVKTASVTAGSGQCTPEMAAACKAGKTSATSAAMSGSCSAHGAKASAAAMSGSCAAHCNASTTSMNASPAGTGCTHNSSAKMMMSKAVDCDACADMAMCADDARDMGANVSIVPLKNGVMFVYTADQPARVQAVQAEMSRRSEHVTAVMAAGDKAKLCPDCKLMRGAMASGKLARELVNIEGGCLTLLTSSDPAMVAKLHAMAGVKGQSRLAKS